MLFATAAPGVMLLGCDMEGGNRVCVAGRPVYSPEKSRGQVSHQAHSALQCGVHVCQPFPPAWTGL